jgi:hypothetical protein
VWCSSLPVKMSLPCQLHDSEHTLEPTIPKLVFAVSFSSDLVAVCVCLCECVSSDSKLLLPLLPRLRLPLLLSLLLPLLGRAT